MSRSRVLWLAEGLSQLIARAAPAERFPAFERLLSRMAYTARPDSRENLDSKRLEWFGCRAAHTVPAAALELAAHNGSIESVPPAALLVEPASLHADMGRLFMTSVGIHHYSETEQQGFSEEVETMLSTEGLSFSQMTPGRWCIHLEEAPDAIFMPLDQALGMDVADALPEGESSLTWRRLINESQVALHNGPVNRARRTEGLACANSLWFWGNGGLGELECDGQDKPPSGVVLSSHPVSRGLAVVIGAESNEPGVEALSAAVANGKTVLLDTPLDYQDPDSSLQMYEALAIEITKAVAAGKAELEFSDTVETSRILGRRQHFSFWRRPLPLKQFSPAGKTQ